MQASHHNSSALLEEPGYLEFSGVQLYTVLHRAPDPLARVLLIGPFASERQNSYLPWVRWARYLAARGIEVLRYDYRGVGESAGRFEEMTFTEWREDVQLLAEWFANRTPALPLILHGLEIGALLATHCFETGMADALLLWSPPATANQALRSTLLRWAGLEQLLKAGAERTTAADYIRQLEQGTAVEVEGYQWSAKLWQESFAWKLPAGFGESHKEFIRNNRAVRSVDLPRKAAPLVKGGFVGYDEVKNFDWLFTEEASWIEAQAASFSGVQK